MVKNTKVPRKGLVLFLYTLGVTGIIFGEPWLVGKLLRLFLILMIIHLLEFIVKFKLFLEDKSTGMYTHFFHTMLFGFFHWLPIQKSLKKKSKNRWIAANTYSGSSENGSRWSFGDSLDNMRIGESLFPFSCCKRSCHPLWLGSQPRLWSHDINGNL